MWPVDRHGPAVFTSQGPRDGWFARTRAKANGEPAAASETIEISGTEYQFDPATVSVDSSGTYTFRLVNDGEEPHALEIEGNGIEEETDTIGPGESAEATVELTEAGDYEMYCPVDDHRGQGMEGTLTVSDG